jgi:hypothetical protein
MLCILVIIKHVKGRCPIIFNKTDMIVKRLTTLELIKIERIVEHPKQTEQKLYIEIFIGSLRFTSPLFAFEGIASQSHSF